MSSLIVALALPLCLRTDVIPEKYAQACFATQTTIPPIVVSTEGKECFLYASTHPFCNGRKAGDSAYLYKKNGETGMSDN
jgi:hypothetical protein